MNKKEIVKRFNVIRNAKVMLYTIEQAKSAVGVTDIQYRALEQQSDELVSRRDLAWAEFEYGIEPYNCDWSWKLIDEAVTILTKSIK